MPFTDLPSPNWFVGSATPVPAPSQGCSICALYQRNPQRLRRVFAAWLARMHRLGYVVPAPKVLTASMACPASGPRSADICVLCQGEVERPLGRGFIHPYSHICAACWSVLPLPCDGHQDRGVLDGSATRGASFGSAMRTLPWHLTETADGYRFCETCAGSRVFRCAECRKPWRGRADASRCCRILCSLCRESRRRLEVQLGLCKACWATPEDQIEAVRVSVKKVLLGLRRVRNLVPPSTPAPSAQLPVRPLRVPNPQRPSESPDEDEVQTYCRCSSCATARNLRAMNTPRSTRSTRSPRSLRPIVPPAPRFVEGSDVDYRVPYILVDLNAAGPFARRLYLYGISDRNEVDLRACGCCAEFWRGLGYEVGASETLPRGVNIQHRLGLSLALRLDDARVTRFENEARQYYGGSPALAAVPAAAVQANPNVERTV